MAACILTHGFMGANFEGLSTGNQRRSAEETEDEACCCRPSPLHLALREIQRKAERKARERRRRHRERSNSQRSLERQRRRGQQASAGGNFRRGRGKPRRSASQEKETSGDATRYTTEGRNGDRGKGRERSASVTNCEERFTENEQPRLRREGASSLALHAQNLPVKSGGDPESAKLLCRRTLRDKESRAQEATPAGCRC
ncbi:hypothetical protein TGPRC2_425670 [Toxoplasma gondii TgCatPRC2]|uniref:Uncharacterized protein n=1 Tax=Toxoplasma gondii TgCatPRC2 TaxID=1130821 RepID=A0A151H9U1_TOXGO|nr:hypothetical protein TGPRC2_425670 [Toxoplasma gondii TgCatPRC2]